MCSMKRLPDIENVGWPKGLPTKGLKSNKSIFCPYLKGFAAIAAHCYNCEIGLNEDCPALNLEVRLEPKILREIYKTAVEFVPESLDEFQVVHDFKLLKDSKLRLDKLHSDIFFIKLKYRAIVRFVPKYETLEHPYEPGSFFIEGVKKLLSYEELGDFLSTGDYCYLIKKDKALEKVYKLTKRLETGNR